jgi:hypothetical protein
MVSSLSISKKSYLTAKNILTESFSNEIPQKFKIIEKLTNIKFSGGEDPYILYADIQKIIESFSELNIDINTILLYFVWNGFSTEFQDTFVNILNKAYPTLDEINEKFIEACNRYMLQQKSNACFLNKSHHAKNNYNSQYNSTSNFAANLNSNNGAVMNKYSNCLLCKKIGNSNHSVPKCTRFNSSDKKIAQAKKLKLCFKCLSPEHFASACNYETKGNCYKCNKKHLSFLCTYEKVGVRKQNNSLVSNNDENFNSNLSASVISNSIGMSVNIAHLDATDSLLPLASLHTCSPKQNNKLLLTMFDSGSQHSFITDDVASKLKLRVLESNINLTIKGFNGNQTLMSKLVELPIIIGNGKKIIKCLCVPKININIKTNNLSSLIKKFEDKGISLANKKFSSKNQNNIINNIELLIGANDWGAVLEWKSGSLGMGSSCGFYETPRGIILIGSIKQWIQNFERFSDKFQNCSPVSSVNASQVVNKKSNNDKSRSKKLSNKISSKKLKNKSSSDKLKNQSKD